MMGALEGAACPDLAELDFADNAIGDAGAVAVAAALSSGSCGAMMALDLSLNEIGQVGTAALTAALASGQCAALAAALARRGPARERWRAGRPGG